MKTIDSLWFEVRWKAREVYEMYDNSSWPERFIIVLFWEMMIFWPLLAIISVVRSVV